MLRPALDPLQVHADVLEENGIELDAGRLRDAYDWSWERYLRGGYVFATQYEAYLQGARDTFDRAGVTDQDGRLARAVMDRMADRGSVVLYDEVLPVVGRLRREGIAIGVATGRWHDPRPDLEATGLAEFVDPDAVFHAGILEAQKDDPAYWRRLLRRAGLEKTSVALVDDNLDAVSCAGSCGLWAILIRRTDSPLQEAPGSDLKHLAPLPALFGME